MICEPSWSGVQGGWGWGQGVGNEWCKSIGINHERCLFCGCTQRLFSRSGARGEQNQSSQSTPKASPPSTLRHHYNIHGPAEKRVGVVVEPHMSLLANYCHISVHKFLIALVPIWSSACCSPLCGASGTATISASLWHSTGSSLLLVCAPPAGGATCRFFGGLSFESGRRLTS